MGISLKLLSNIAKVKVSGAIASTFDVAARSKLSELPGVNENCTSLYQEAASDSAMLNGEFPTRTLRGEHHGRLRTASPASNARPAAIRPIDPGSGVDVSPGEYERVPSIAKLV